MKVVFLTNIVSPYRRGVFERLAATPGWDFRVLVNAESEFDRAWDVSLGTLPIRRTKSLSFRRRVVTHTPVRFEQNIEFHVPTHLWGDLRAFRPDVIISHELGPRTGVAAAYARTHGCKLAIWAYQSRVSGTQGGIAKRFIRRVLLRQAHVAIGMGVQAREVLSLWGVEDRRIVDAPNAADHVDLDCQLSAETLPDQVAAIRSRFGGKRIALVIGRLIPLKGIPEMLSAWARLPAAVKSQWQLVFVGDGPLRPLIDSAGPGVCCVGAAKTTQTASWYRAAALHIFPTLGDVWGLVVNEASQCGTPSLCSVHAGCCDDMIDDGVSGLLFDPVSAESSTRDLAAALTREDLQLLGNNARESARSFTLDGLANGFRQAVHRAVTE